jgi:hypothetical protein
MGLTKYTLENQPKTIVVYPYQDADGFPDGLSPAWKDVGYKVLIPTMRLIHHLGRHGVTMRQGKEGDSTFTYPEVDLVALAKYYCNTVIQGWEGVEDEGNTARYDPDWLFSNFDRYPFLFNRLITAYRNLIDNTKKEFEKEEADFLST